MKRVPEFLADLLGLAGAGAVSYGVWLMYEPAGVIVAGGFAIVAAAILATPRK